MRTIGKHTRSSFGAHTFANVRHRSEHVEPLLAARILPFVIGLIYLVFYTSSFLSSTFFSALMFAAL